MTSNGLELGAEKSLGRGDAHLLNFKPIEDEVVHCEICGTP